MEENEGGVGRLKEGKGGEGEGFGSRKEEWRR